MTEQGDPAVYVRVVFPLDPAAWHGSASERLWAEPVGADRYILRNTPFYVFGVSYGDIVFGDERDGQVYFRSVSIRSGHSTYRLWVKPAERAQFAARWAPLGALGCSYEGGVVHAVDVPATSDVHAVYAVLEDGERAGYWEFEEGHCGHLLTSAQERRGGAMRAAVKLHVRLEQDEEGYPPIAVESLWGEPTGAPDEYVIVNIPFFARNATLGDTVRAPERDGQRWVEGVVASGAASLLRVLFFEVDRTDEVTAELEALGCETEGLPAYRLVAVSVPADIELTRVQALLRQRQDRGELDYEEPLLRHPA